MTPEEKAEQLVNEYYEMFKENGWYQKTMENAINAALLTVKHISEADFGSENIAYWEQVKNEILNHDE